MPDKAIDLIDEAGARVKLRQTTLPSEVADIQKRIKFIVHRMENAIANHEFEKARFYSDEERKERENLRALRENTIWTIPRPALFRKTISKMWWRAGPACR